MANPFHIALGDLAGKVPGGVSGNYCLTIGEVEDGMLDELAPGNYVQYAQNIDITGINYLRLWMSGALPSGWGMRVMIDGAPERVIDAFISDSPYNPCYVNVSGINGVHAFALRLERIAA